MYCGLITISQWRNLLNWCMYIHTALVLFLVTYKGTEASIVFSFIVVYDNRKDIAVWSAVHPVIPYVLQRNIAQKIVFFSPSLHCSVYEPFRGYLYVKFSWKLNPSWKIIWRFTFAVYYNILDTELDHYKVNG